MSVQSDKIDSEWVEVGVEERLGHAVNKTGTGSSEICYTQFQEGQPSMIEDYIDISHGDSNRDQSLGATDNDFVTSITTAESQSVINYNNPWSDENNTEAFIHNFTLSIITIIESISMKLRLISQKSSFQLNINNFNINISSFTYDNNILAYWSLSNTLLGVMILIFLLTSSSSTPRTPSSSPNPTIGTETNSTIKYPIVENITSNVQAKSNTTRRLSIVNNFAYHSSGINKEMINKTCIVYYEDVVTDNVIADRSDRCRELFQRCMLQSMVNTEKVNDADNAKYYNEEVQDSYYNRNDANVQSSYKKKKGTDKVDEFDNEEVQDSYYNRNDATVQSAYKKKKGTDKVDDVDNNEVQDSYYNRNDETVQSAYKKKKGTDKVNDDDNDEVQDSYYNRNDATVQSAYKKKKGTDKMNDNVNNNKKYSNADCQNVFKESNFNTDMKGKSFDGNPESKPFPKQECDDKVKEKTDKTHETKKSHKGSGNRLQKFAPWVV